MDLKEFVMELAPQTTKLPEGPPSIGQVKRVVRLRNSFQQRLALLGRQPQVCTSLRIRSLLTRQG